MLERGGGPLNPPPRVGPCVLNVVERKMRLYKATSGTFSCERRVQEVRPGPPLTACL